MRKNIVNLFAQGIEYDCIESLMENLSIEELGHLKLHIDRILGEELKLKKILCDSNIKIVILKTVTDKLGYQKTYRFILDEKNHNLYGVNERGEFCIGKYSDDLRVCFADIRWNKGGYDSLPFAHPYFYNGMIDATNHMLLARASKTAYIDTNSTAGLNDLLGFDTNAEEVKEITSNDDGLTERLVAKAYSSLNSEQKRIVSEISEICSANEELKDTVNQFIKK